MTRYGKQLKEPCQSIHLLGTRLSLCSREKLLYTLKEAVIQDNQFLVLSGNVHSFNLAYENQWLRDFFNQADIVRLDGAGLRLGAKMLGISSPPRMTWADFAWDLAQLCAENEFSIYFLGGKPGVAEKAAVRLQTKYPTLKLAGCQHGYFDKTMSGAENEAVITAVNNAHPDILLIGFGMPIQEKWLLENKEKLNASVIMTGGAVFDYISGELQRAPKWMTDNGLEWLGRLLVEPRRLWQRYLIGNPLFLWRVLKQCLC